MTHLKIYRQIFENSSNIKFHFKKPRPVGAEFLHADGRTDRWTGRHDERNSRFSQFCESAWQSEISGTFRTASSDHSLVNLQNMNVINIRSRLESVSISLIASRRCQLLIALRYWHVRGEIAWWCPSGWACGTRTGTPTQIDSEWLNVPVLQICSNLKE